MEKTNITIIGAGIIGLACAYELSKKHKDILIIEKNPFFGQETSSRNSEVIHAGLYYQPDSYKANLCIRGKDLLYALCASHNIPHKKVGKLLVAKTEDEIQRIEKTYNNAIKSGVEKLRFITKAELKQMEPDIEAEKAFFSPETGIIDTHALMKFYLDSSKNNGAEIIFNTQVIGINKTSTGYLIKVQESSGDTFEFTTNAVINAAGFDSDKVAAMVGIEPDKHGYKIYYSKGQYFRIEHPKKFRITHLVYPPPSHTDLGIHVTPDLGGGLRLGPDAKYIDCVDYNLNVADKEIFYKSFRRYCPKLELDDLIPDTVGIRAKTQQKDDLFKDFVIEEESKKGFPNFINLIGIESPGVTASLAIAEQVRSLLQKTL
ncbi:MAG: NAD(P)/FAD-dependent oxidoreductase [Candidatus Omnitrophica bacterium]|nr:NAD(P)/FAD-dependent oxidoreductase [Candidatus Omnitrophota bacterium]